MVFGTQIGNCFFYKKRQYPGLEFEEYSLGSEGKLGGCTIIGKEVSTRKAGDWGPHLMEGQYQIRPARPSLCSAGTPLRKPSQGRAFLCHLLYRSPFMNSSSHVLFTLVSWKYLWVCKWDARLSTLVWKEKVSNTPELDVVVQGLRALDLTRPRIMEESCVTQEAKGQASLCTLEVLAVPNF